MNAAGLDELLDRAASLGERAASRRSVVGVGTFAGRKGCSRFAQEITKARIKRNETQRQVAAILGVLHTTINSWDRGRHLPNESKLSRLASVLEIETDHLVTLWREAGGKP